MSKTSNSVPKIHCERYKKHLRNYANTTKYRPMRKIVISKKILNPTEKSYSTGIINKVETRKKTQSDYHFYDKLNIDSYCKTCGDCKNKTSNKHTTHSAIQSDIQQYYRNENYQSCDSINPRKSLNTITEKSESSPEICAIYPDSDEEVTLMDPNNDENIQNLKEFRKNNYFECHSAKSRINNSSAANINNHKCVYRFYLNDRLFPVSINTDYKKVVRCMECQLPLKENSNLTGTIQTKVKINNELQDMLLMLPVKNSLIIEERRKKENEIEDCLYFGIIKLDLNGDSMFNRTLPENSLALRYQKGYQEFTGRDKYEYESVEKDDVIII